MWNIFYEFIKRRIFCDSNFCKNEIFSILNILYLTDCRYLKVSSCRWEDNSQTINTRYLWAKILIKENLTFHSFSFDLRNLFFAISCFLMTSLHFRSITLSFLFTLYILYVTFVFWQYMLFSSYSFASFITLLFQNCLT